MAAAREPSMEDILASIKRVIAEEKEIRAAAPPPRSEGEGDEAPLRAAQPPTPVPPHDPLGEPVAEDPLVVVAPTAVAHSEPYACSSEGASAGWTDQAGGTSLPASSSRSASSAVPWTRPAAWWTGA